MVKSASAGTKQPTSGGSLRSNLAIMTRIELLRDLIEVAIPIPMAASRLAELAWDAEADLVELKPEHCTNVISQFIRGSIARSEGETWANAVEGREDIGISAPMVGEVLHELANPRLTFPLSPSRAEVLLKLLQNDG